MKSDKRGKGKSAKPPGPRSASSSEIRSVDGISSGRPHAFSIQREDIGLTRMLETLKPHDHLCLIYESQEEWRAAAAPFISIGLKQGEKCIYIVDTSTAEEIRKYLLEEGVDVASAEKSGQLSILHETEAYTREGSFDPDRMIALLISETEKAVSEGYPALRTTGEMTWVLRGYPGSAKLLEYEAKLNRDLFPKYPCLAICQYDRWKFDPEIIKGVIMTHPLLVRGSRVYRNFYYVDPGEFLNKKRAEREVQHWLNNVEREQRLWEELHKNEERFRIAAVSASDLIWDWDIPSGKLDWFGDIDGILGYQPGEFQRTIDAWEKAIHSGDVARVNAALERQLKKGEPYCEEYRIKCKDGAYRYWTDQGTALRDEKGEPYRMIGACSDITEQKRAEEALRESEDRYRDLVEHSHDLLCTHDLEGKLLSVNPAVLRIGGYSKDELLGMNFGDFLAPEVRGRFGNYLTEIQAKGAASGVMLVQTKGGEKRLWEYHNTLRTEGIATPIVRGMARDITEHKNAEKALQESENRYRTLVENSNDGIALVKGDIHLYVNQKFLEIFGYNHIEEIVGRPISITIHPDDRDRVVEMNRRRQTKEGEPSKYEFKGIQKDGSIVYIEVAATKTTYQGEAVSLSYHRDITERKHTEEALRESGVKFRDLYDNAPVGYFEYDAQGRITNVNRTELEMLGYTLDEMIGQPVWKFIMEDVAQDQILAKLAGTIPSEREFERTYRRKNGSILPVLAEDRLLRDSEGRIAGIRCTIQDITERKRSEEEKASLQEQLRQSQKIEAIGRLSGGIAHDFNNILTIISGNAQLSLLDLRQGDPLRANIEEIKGASERAADLTRQLLAFSRKQMMEMKVLDLNLIVQGLDKMLHRLLGEDIDLVTVLPEGIGKVKADPGQIEQVIVNLAVNARDAMIEGGKLTIETADVELDEEYARKHIAVIPGRYVMLSVSDTGVGMTSEVKDWIFEPFFTTKEQGKGTGLGLSTVYGIVKQSGGNIWVYSEPGQGTTFKIYLPQVDEPLTEEKQEVIKEIPRGDETILVVEDEETVRKLAIRLLKRQGYRVLEASDGGKALLLCEKFKERIHLILTDVVMPGMSGRKLVERLKEIHPEMKVLYMSGYTDNAIIHHGVLEPGINFMQKPFTLENLARKVREALDK